MQHINGWTPDSRLWAIGVRLDGYPSSSPTRENLKSLSDCWVLSLFLKGLFAFVHHLSSVWRHFRLDKLKVYTKTFAISRVPRRWWGCTLLEWCWLASVLTTEWQNGSRGVCSKGEQLCHLDRHDTGKVLGEGKERESGAGHSFTPASQVEVLCLFTLSSLG